MPLTTAIEAVPWVIGCIAIPLLAALLSFLVGKRAAAVVGVIAAPITGAMSAMLVWQTVRLGAHRHTVGGWGAPLGIDLYVDGLAALLVAMTSLVGLCASVYAWGYFASDDPSTSSDDEHASQAHRRKHFWPVWLCLWAALHALFVSADVFNLYVTLEIVGLAAVALVALSGDEGVSAAMRYLLVTLVGSMFFLLGVGLLYAAFGTLDLYLLAERVEPGPGAWAALALMAAGMVLKTALFPTHFWLPPAHAAAPSPVSAVLSGLVVKASFYLLVRLWLEVFGGVVRLEIAHLLAGLGMVAIVWGSIQALLQTRLKLLVAYSTVAQLGYLFVIFPVAMHGATDAWRGGVYYAASHACAKAAMFMAAGTLQHAVGEGTVEALRGAGPRLFVTFAAFALAGVTLMGLPPSGGFVGKWLIARAAIAAEQWVIVGVVFVGGVLAAAYVFRVIQMAFVPAGEGAPVELRPVPLTMRVTPLVLALVAILLGLIASEPLALLEIGEPFPGRPEPGGAP